MEAVAVNDTFAPVAYVAAARSHHVAPTAKLPKTPWCAVLPQMVRHWHVTSPLCFF